MLSYPLFQSNVAVSKTLVAASFGIGLAMIVFLGTELFTGNCFTTIMPVYTKQKKLIDLLPAWTICYIGNFIDSAIVCILFIASGSLKDVMTIYLTNSIQTKLAFDVMQLLCKAILCNLVVCVGAYAGIKVQDNITKFMLIIIIVIIFVLPGFEHCIANMSTYTMGMCLLQSSIDWSLLPLHMVISTIGNILGGIVLLGLPIYLTFKD